MEQANLNNSVATSVSPKTDALIQSAIDGAADNNNSVTYMFWVIAVMFFVAFLAVRKKQKGATVDITTQPVEYSALSKETKTSDVLNLARHGHSSSSRVFDEL